ncbi:MAG: hypothetical protein V4773_14385 [Verrucomicrobiota bacterium]
MSLAYASAAGIEDTASSDTGFVADDFAGGSGSAPAAEIEHRAVTASRIAHFENPQRSRRTITRQESGSSNGTVISASFAATQAGVFHELSRWEGVVIQENGDEFSARLTDPYGKRADEEAEFPIDEIPSFDRELVQQGAVFYWSIGYWDSISGLRSRISQIRFRRLPVWSASELRKARANAGRLSELFT